jgi:hypothetical protein
MIYCFSSYRDTTMKRRNIFQSMMAAGLALSSVVMSTLVLGSSVALADDDTIDSWEWRDRCEQTLDPVYCDPLKRNHDGAIQGDIGAIEGDDGAIIIQNGRDGRVRDNRIWRNEDHRDRDWREIYGNRRGYDLRLSEGTSIPTRVGRQGRIVLRRGERYSLRLITDRDLLSERSGRVVIPRGSSIYGVLVPYRGGYRFESQYVKLRDGGERDIWAVSDVIDSRDRYFRSDDEPILSPAAAIIWGTLIGRSITPNSDRLGDIFDRDYRARRDLIVIYPNRDLDLRLSRDFVLRYR